MSSRDDEAVDPSRRSFLKTMGVGGVTIMGASAGVTMLTGCPEGDPNYWMDSRRRLTLEALADTALPNEGILSAPVNYTGRDKEGLLTRILEFRREGGRIKWSQRYNVPTFGGVTAIAVTPAPGTISNSGPRVLLLGRFSQWQIAESRSRDASTTRHARCVQFASDTPGAMLAAVGLRLGDPRTLTRLGRVQWVRKHAQPEDRVQLIVVADNRHVWNAGVRRGTPAVWDLTDAPLGPAWEWDLYVLLDDNAQTDAVAPYGVLGLVEHEDVGQPYVSLAQHPGFAVEGKEDA